MNWGYWGTSASSPRGLIATHTRRAGVGSIEPTDGHGRPSTPLPPRPGPTSWLYGQDHGGRSGHPAHMCRASTLQRARLGRGVPRPVCAGDRRPAGRPLPSSLGSRAGEARRRAPRPLLLCSRLRAWGWSRIRPPRLPARRRMLAGWTNPSPTLDRGYLHLRHAPPTSPVRCEPG